MHLLLLAFLTSVTPSIYAAPVASVKFEFAPDDSDADRVETMASWGFFTEAISEIRRLDAGKYAKLRETYKPCPKQHKVILERGWGKPEEFAAIPSACSKAHAALGNWETYRADDGTVAKRTAAQWIASINARRQAFERWQKRYGLPDNIYPAPLGEVTGDLDQDGTAELYLAYFIRPADRILSDWGSNYGQQYLKGFLLKHQEAVPMGVFGLRDSLVLSLSTRALAGRGILFAETPSGGAAAGPVHYAFSVVDRRLYRVDLVEGKQRRPFEVVEAGSAGYWTTIDISTDGAHVAIRDGEGHGGEKVERDEMELWYDWDGENFALSSADVHFEGHVSRGDSFRHILPAGFSLRLDPAKYGWIIAVNGPHPPSFPYSQAGFTPPLHGINPTDIAGWHFRNAANTGPNEPGPRNVNAPQHVREFIFSDRIGNGIGYPPTEEDLGTIMKDGHGRLTVQELDLSPPKQGEQARIERMRFSVDLTMSLRPTESQ